MAIEISITDGMRISVECETPRKEPTIRNKGRSLLSIPDNYTVLDLETTGLNPAFDSIIEVACIKYRNGEEVDSYHTYVQPPAYYDEDDNGIETEYYVDEFITELTGITNEMLENAPTFDVIADELSRFLSDEVIVGHNVNFDINFLYDNYKSLDGTDFRNDFLDTMRIARLLLPELPHHRLTDLAEHFEIEGIHHRAMEDCRTTQGVLQNLGRLLCEQDIDLEALLKQKNRCDLTALTADQSSINPDHMFYRQNCVFTGKLKRFTRKDAAQLVVNIGGCCENNITKSTNFLIIGSMDSPQIKNKKSSKLKKAEKLILAGQDLKILSEDTFYELIEEEQQR